MQSLEQENRGSTLRKTGTIFQSAAIGACVFALGSEIYDTDAKVPITLAAAARIYWKESI